MVRYRHSVVADSTIEIFYITTVVNNKNAEYKKTFLYDSLNRVVTENFSNGQYIEYIYDDSGNLIQQNIIK